MFENRSTCTNGIGLFFVYNVLLAYYRPRVSSDSFHYYIQTVLINVAIQNWIPKEKEYSIIIFSQIDLKYFQEQNEFISKIKSTRHSWKFL